MEKRIVPSSPHSPSAVKVDAEANSWSIITKSYQEIRLLVGACTRVLFELFLLGAQLLGQVLLLGQLVLRITTNRNLDRIGKRHMY